MKTNQDLKLLATGVVRLLEKGGKINAIKFVREKTDYGLKESKDFVDHLESLMRSSVVESTQATKNDLQNQKFPRDYLDKSRIGCSMGAFPSQIPHDYDHSSA
jgi:hypothetical protein